MKNIKFINGNATDKGGAIYWYGANGTINNSIFTNNKAKQSGGAIYWQGANGTINNSIFTNNTSLSGGAINWGMDVLNGVVTNSIFIANTGTDGGAIYWEGINGRMDNCNFTNNKASNGGAINWQKRYGQINSCNFMNNTATNGGAIHWEGSNGTATACNFMNNTATNGGAIHWYAYNGTVSNSNFTNNKASDGGAIQWQGTNGTMTDSYFFNNTAEFNGGAIAIADSGAKIDNAKFINNTAAKFGGAIYVDGDDSAISNSELSGNRAADGTDNVAVEAGAESPLTDNVTSDKGNIISFVTEINATSASDIYQRGNPVVINIKTNAKKGTVSITVKDKTYNSTVKNGATNITIPNLATGTYNDIVVSYHDPTGDYSDASDNVTFTVKAIVTEINATSAGDVYQNDKPIVINIKTNAKEGTVSITVKGKTYNSTVKDGVATISIPDLVVGTYNDIVVSYHDPTGDYSDASDNVTFTVKVSKVEIINKDINKDYNSNYNYNIRIIGADGEPVSGETIKISINGKIKSFKTDSKGDIIIKMGKTYIPGKYTVKLSYKGISSKHVITVKQILKSKKVVKIKKNAKKAVLKATLKSSNGKAIKGKKITFKIKGKTYKAKTNKKGIAEITLKNKVIKKFKAGKTYTVKITYLKDTIKTKLKVKK